MTVSIDGNFGLVRKKNAGSSSTEPLYPKVYFVDQKETDAFVGTYGCDKATDRVRMC